MSSTLTLCKSNTSNSHTHPPPTIITLPGVSTTAEPTPAIKSCLRWLCGVGDSSSRLCVDDFFAAICEMMTGSACDALIGGFLSALTSERFTPEILAACARALREHSVPLILPTSITESIDIVGTGGDGTDTFNVSTTTAFVLCASGVCVVKHGNRSSSSKCGSADLIEQSGAVLSLTSEQALQCVQQCNFVFLFAQAYHPAMKHVSVVRKQLGIKTIFNVLGPLSNPCIPAYQLTGVYDKRLGRLFAASFHELGVKRAMVVHGVVHGMDEISPTGKTLIWQVNEQGEIQETEVTPEDFGLPSHSLDEIRSGNAKENVKTLERVLQGEDCPQADWVLMNSSAALMVAGKATDWKDGVRMARQLISSGKAMQAFKDYIRISQAVAEQKKPSILETIAKHRQTLVDSLKSHLPLESLLHSALWKIQAPKLQNVLERLRKGDINVHADVVAQSVLYAKSGAAVISVLTEPKWFKGSLSDLRSIRSAVDSLPNRPCILLKDFVVDPYQLVEARLAGADTVLLIVAILPLPKLLSFMHTSRLLGMEPLVEVANAKEMDIALKAGARLIGVNNRDLHTFTVNTNTTTVLSQMITAQEQGNPEDFKVLLAALSGIKTRADVEQYARCGCEAVLVGETLMRAENVQQTIAELLGQTSLLSSSTASHHGSPSTTHHSLQVANQHHRTRSNSMTSIKPVLITPPHTPTPSSTPALTTTPAAAGQATGITLSPAFQPISTMSRDMPLPTLSIPITHSNGHAHQRQTQTAREPPIVKICGLSSVSSAFLAYEAGADLLGLIFVPTSKRKLTVDNASMIVRAIQAEASRKCIADQNQTHTEKQVTHTENTVGSNNSEQQQSWIHKQAFKLKQLVIQRRSVHLPVFVGVFQDQSVDEMNSIADAVGLDVIQCHGHESNHIIAQLNRPVIRVVPIIPQLTKTEDLHNIVKEERQSNTERTRYNTEYTAGS